MKTEETHNNMQDNEVEHSAGNEEIEGLDQHNELWDDYPIDALLIRSVNRTIYDVIRRIKQNNYVMDPDFQRDFIWPIDKQSKLVESVLMRIPLPVFYMAENDEGKSVVVDGLQRLSTFYRFVSNKQKLQLPDRNDLNGKRFEDLSPKLQNRIEDFNLTFYIIDSNAPDRACLDIFERVNSGVPLTRQQMRNSLFMGKATKFLKDESKTDIFLKVTGYSLNTKNMRDREFVNRFCAFRVLGTKNYRGDMDEHLAKVLREMNTMRDDELTKLSDQLRRSLANNYELFGRHAFRKSMTGQISSYRSVINASLWDVMSTGLCRYTEDQVRNHAEILRVAIQSLLQDEKFVESVTIGTNDTRRVNHRFKVTREKFEEILFADSN